jgi:hypothetical protein
MVTSQANDDGPTFSDGYWYKYDIANAQAIAVINIMIIDASPPIHSSPSPYRILCTIIPKRINNE